MSDTASALTRSVRIVERPPTWRAEPYAIAYVLPDAELTAEQLITAHEWAWHEALPNPRVITPSVLRWSSLFNPRFFNAVMADPTFTADREQRALAWANPALEHIDSTRFWLQSLLFLAGVTLSAAIVQSRRSAGTIGSKLDRLWEAGVLAESGVASDLQPLALKEVVRSLAKTHRFGNVDSLFAIRRLFMAALARLAPTDGDVVTMAAGRLSFETADRFGLVDMLREACGPQLHAVIVYGSSVASATFADYDLLLVVDNAEAVLRTLADRSPSWHGKELNIGVYTPDEMLVMQRLSGDNIGEYGLCLWGEAAIVRKPVDILLARNLSFGVVRQRQQLGMLSRAVGDPLPADGDDRRNLHDYFVKIPANVAKGTFGAIGSRLSKEEVQAWLIAQVGFDVAAEQARARVGYPVRALANAAIATGAVLDELNMRAGLVAPAVDRPRMRER